MWVRWWEGAFTHYLALGVFKWWIYSLSGRNMTAMLGYFSKSKCQHLPQYSNGFMISKQPNTYIEKMQNFWTGSNKVEERRWLNIGYNTQEVLEIQAGFKDMHCVFSGLHDKPNWQEFPVKWSRVQHLVKNWTKQPLQTFSASKDPQFIPGELLSITDQDILYQDFLQGSYSPYEPLRAIG
jgi:hypothetical protein